MKSKKNGFTTIELVTTFALTMVIVVLLMQIIVVLKNVYVSRVIVDNLKIKQSLMTEKIMDDFDNKEMIGTTGCLDKSDCISFIWEDGSITQLSVDPTNKTFTYGDYVTQLTGTSYYGNISVTDIPTSATGNTSRRYISINFPVYSSLTNGDYGVHVLYQFDSSKTGIHASDFNTHNQASLFVLKGDSTVVIQNKSDYVEPGWKIFYDGAYHDNDAGVSLSYTSNGVTVSGIQDINPTIITYTYTASDGTKYTQQRAVTYSKYQYSYTGNFQTFVVPSTGYYKLETWGASGGDYSTQLGGKGGYTSGAILLNAGQTLYIYVGSSPGTSETGGYNGGGSLISGQSVYGRAGGGATDIRLVSGTWSDTTSLRSRIIVAGGGGGADYRNYNDTSCGYGQGDGGAGGGLTGGTGTTTNHTYGTCTYGWGQGTGGKQTSGGYYYGYNSSGTLTDTILTGAFGTADTHVVNTQSGGGGGYYGGGDSGHGGAGGGSSYISGEVGCVAVTSATDSTPKSGCSDGTTDITCSYHYSGLKFLNTTIIPGSDSMPTHDGSSYMTGNSGNGYAKITYIGNTNAMATGESISYAYQGAPQVFTAPSTGYYQLEAWGAQGGTANSAIGGKGAFTTGEIYLSANESIYIYVGGQGGVTASGQVQHVVGGYNGGGDTGGQACCNRLFGSGGGASDFRVKSGTWNDNSSLASRIMVAAGGGGAFDGDNCAHLTLNGGAGGALTGIPGVEGSTDCDSYCYGLGGSQTSGGSITTSCAHSSDVGGGIVTGAFGIGGGNNGPSTGGGGGYYGGSNSGHIASAGGGSSYVSGYNGCVATSKVFVNANMIDGNSSVPTHTGVSTMNGNTGNGYAKITYMGTSAPSVPVTE